MSGGWVCEQQVYVCESCLRASCWQNEHRCEQASTANIRQMPISELEKLELESPHYWKEEE